jgi:hypothetical protein
MSSGPGLAADPDDADAAGAGRGGNRGDSAIIGGWGTHLWFSKNRQLVIVARPEVRAWLQLLAGVSRI